MAMKHFPNAQKMDIASLNIEGINSFLQDVVSSNDANAPITCGFFRMEKGNPLEYTYSYDECKIMLEGEMTLTDSDGNTVNFRPGDVVYFDNGTKIVFASNSSGLAFYVGQREEGKL